jgi:prepilin-type N-terminal cleavage/methylation domain-containing protein
VIARDEPGLALRTEITMPTKRKQFCCGSIQAGFSLVELLIVVAIMMVTAAIAVPKVSDILNGLRLRGAAQQLSELYQQARMKAVQDDSYYEVLISADNRQVYVDIAGNGTPSNLVLPLPPAMSLNNAGVPPGLDQKTLGFDPVVAETSVMFDRDGTNRPGLAWSSRGLPCQRSSATSLCQAGVGWLQYLQLQEGAQVAYAAVSVSPAGRVKVWKYQGGAWR